MTPYTSTWLVMSFSSITTEYRKTQAMLREKNHADRQQRRRIAKSIGALAATVALLYGHSLVDNHLDATIGGIPLPQPIEAIVDWANMPDHTATAFSKPEHAAPITVGDKNVTIPFVATYDTHEAPDASYLPLEDQYGGEVIKPGLWESDFDFGYHPKTRSTKKSAQFDDRDCYTINGNFLKGKTWVFTQTPDINKHITLNVVDSDRARVCKKDPEAKDFNGSLYFWQTR